MIALTLVGLASFFATILNLSVPRFTFLIRTSRDRAPRFFVIFSFLGCGLSAVANFPPGVTSLMPATSNELAGSGHVSATWTVSAAAATGTASGSASPACANVSVTVFGGAAWGPGIGGGGGGGGG